MTSTEESEIEPLSDSRPDSFDCEEKFNQVPFYFRAHILIYNLHGLLYSKIRKNDNKVKTTTEAQQ